ncbi:MAG: glutathione S-transferase family protein [Gammaproteobacteria bacterium]|nr:glutathione S-transferase family protein [Gammaproteobacteria bacterium]
MNTLYTVATANGQRASVALEECGIEYETRPVDLFAGEHRSEEMLALNPFGRMPVLQLDGGNAIYGGMAIGMHAANLSGKLLPSANDKDAFHEWVGIIMSDLVPASAGLFYLGTLAPEKFEWGISFYTEIIGRFLSGIDAHLASSEYFLPGGYSLIDVLMYPSAATSVANMPGGLEPYPNIARWVTLVGAREAVKAGMESSS